MKIVMNPRQFIGWGLFALLIFILCWRECTRPNLSLGIDHSLRDSAVALTEKIESQRLKDSARLTDSIFKIQIEKGQSDLRVNQLSTQLDNSVAYSRQLAAQLKDANILIEDTGSTLVPNDYIENCIECGDQILKQSTLVGAYKEEVLARDQIHKKELSLKDSMIFLERRSNIAGRISLGMMEKAYSALERSISPHNQVYAGIVAQGNEITFIQGAGLGATLITKTSKLYGVDAIMVRNGNLLFNLRGQFLINFRKRKN